MEDIPWAHAPSTSVVSDALDALGINGVVEEVRPVAPGQTPVAGWAHVGVVRETVTPGIPGLTDFLDRAAAGSFLILAWEAKLIAATFGGLAASRAMAAGCVGVLTAGWVRDLDELLRGGIPLWARGITPRSGRGRLSVEARQEVVLPTGISVSSGDLVVGDRTGVCVIPRSSVPDATAEVDRIEVQDREMSKRISEGMSFGAASREIGAT